MESLWLVVYPGHAVLVNVSNWFRQSETWNTFMPVGFLHVNARGSGKGEKHKEDPTDKLSVYLLSSFALRPRMDSVRLTLTSTACEERVIVLQDAVYLLSRPLGKSIQDGLSLQDRSSDLWRWFPVLLSYCCDMPEREGVSIALQVSSVSRPCLGCISTVEDIGLRRGWEARDPAEAKAARTYSREKETEGAVPITKGNWAAH